MTSPPIVQEHYLKCHLIFVCKYRKAMLIGQVNDDAKRIFSSIAENSDFEIEVMERDKDHVHFPVRYIPRLSTSTNSSQVKAEEYTAVVVAAWKSTS